MLRIIQLLSILAYLNGSLSQDGAACTLPDSRQTGECKRLLYCDSLWLPIKNQEIPQNDAKALVLKHSICDIKSYVCCPGKDSSVKPTTASSVVNTPTPPPLTTDPTTSVRKANDLNAIRQHKNFRLLNRENCGVINADRIIGGEEADLGEFPWMALLKYNLRNGETSYGCGGALITPLYVLTAAHCVTRELVGVRLGEHSLKNVTDCDHNGQCLAPVQDFDVAKPIKHTGYKYATKIDDIGMVKLNRPADLTKNNVNTICIPLTKEDQIESLKITDPAVVKAMTITGWGKIADGSQSDVLMKAYVPYVENAECKKRYYDEFGDQLQVLPTFLCAGGENKKQKIDTCRGDSGGPIQTFSFTSGSPKSYIYGVVSSGLECLNQDIKFPGIYTNIAFYLDWILDRISDQ